MLHTGAQIGRVCNTGKHTYPDITTTTAMGEKAKVFHSSEKVLVYQGKMLYDAKVMKTFDPVTQKVDSYDEKKKDHTFSSPNKKFPQKFLSEVCYMVHYNGWNSKWDEWVLPSRILEINNENIMLKEDLIFQAHEEERLHQEAIEAAEAKRKADEKMKEKKKMSLTIKLPSKNGKIKTENGNSSKNGNENIITLINNNGAKSLKRKGVDDVNENKNSTMKNTQVNGRSNEGSSRKKQNNNSSSSSNSGNSTVLQSNSDVSRYESKNGFTHYEIQSLVPDSLKIILVDDWENITKNNKLISLPGKCTVSQVLDDFSEYLQIEFNDHNKSENDIDIFLEITNSIKIYFDQCVGTLLLYRYERPQYSDLLNQEEISHLYDIYPAIFLLRLLSIFPNILVMNNVDSSTIKTSKVYLEIILFWLDSNKETYLVQEYENQSPWISLMHG
ncbi:Esa1p-associated factor [Pichia californica]|nr:Esa1p-associated factor [[Candida] californica]